MFCASIDMGNHFKWLKTLKQRNKKRGRCPVFSASTSSIGTLILVVGNGQRRTIARLLIVDINAIAGTGR